MRILQNACVRIRGRRNVDKAKTEGKIIVLHHIICSKINLSAAISSSCFILWLISGPLRELPYRFWILMLELLCWAKCILLLLQRIKACSVFSMSHDAADFIQNEGRKKGRWGNWEIYIGEDDHCCCHFWLRYGCQWQRDIIIQFFAIHPSTDLGLRSLNSRKLCIMLPLFSSNIIRLDFLLSKRFSSEEHWMHLNFDTNVHLNSLDSLLKPKP